MIVAESAPTPRKGIISQNDQSSPGGDGSTHSAVSEQHLSEPLFQAVMHDPVAFATVLLVFVTAGLWLTTVLLWRSTVKLAGDAKEEDAVQASKMEASIAEAARAANAMEGVSNSMQINAEQIVESVQHQRVFGRMQMRAYISVAIGHGIYQDAERVFEAQPHIFNKGWTSARRLQWRISADILPMPIPYDFKFPLPEEAAGGSDLDSQQDGMMSMVVKRQLQPEEAEAAKFGRGSALTVWGYLWYDDVFGRRHRRTFAQQLWWFQSGEARPDGVIPLQIRGMHLQRHNRGN